MRDVLFVTSGMIRTALGSAWVRVMLLFVFVADTQGATEFDRLVQQLRPAGLVTDTARVLKPDQREQLEALLSELRQKTGSEIAVVTLASLQGGEINDFANRLFERWGVGQKGKDNGILFLVALQDRKMRVEVGYGLESVLPDAAAGRLLDQFVVPEFRAGRMDRGILAGTAALARTVAAARGVTLAGGPALAPPQRAPSRQPGMWGIVLFVMIWMLIALAARNSRRRRRFHPVVSWGGFGGGYGGGFGGGGGGFGGFGGGSSGGGGASRGW